jgi:hypothetical protein
LILGGLGLAVDLSEEACQLIIATEALRGPTDLFDKGGPRRVCDGTLIDTK